MKFPRWVIGTLAVLAALTVAYLPGLAQPASGKDMPAELELNLSVDYTWVSWTAVGKIPLTIPETGAFKGQGAIPVSIVTFPGTYGISCTPSETSLSVSVGGTRRGMRVAMNIDVNRAQPIMLTCSYVPSDPAAPDFNFPVGANSWIVELGFADNAERTLTDTFPSGKIVAKLHLGCPVAGRGHLDISVTLQKGDGPGWPVDNSKTKAEINNPPPREGVRLATTRWYRFIPTLRGENDTPSRIAGGICYSVEGVHVDFPPITILIPKEYPRGSCNYNALYPHEYKHFTDFSRTFDKYQAKVKQALEDATPTLPTQERPIWATSKATAKTHTDALVKSVLDPVYDSMKEEIDAEGEIVDTSAESDRIEKMCPTW